MRRRLRRASILSSSHRIVDEDGAAIAKHTHDATCGPDRAHHSCVVKVVRLTKDGGQEVVATGLSFSTAMTFGSDGRLYASDVGFGYPPGAGQIVTIDLSLPLPPSTSVRSTHGASPIGGKRRAASPRRRQDEEARQCWDQRLLSGRATESKAP